MIPTPERAPIVFGTDGWRARIADEFTFDAVRRCADGVARYVVERSAGRLTISEGPRPVIGPSPSALIAGGASFRGQIEDLVARVAAWEERQ